MDNLDITNNFIKSEFVIICDFFTC